MANPPVLRVIHEAACACAYGYPDLKPEQKKVLKSFVEFKGKTCSCRFQPGMGSLYVMPCYHLFLTPRTE